MNNAFRILDLSKFEIRYHDTDDYIMFAAADLLSYLEIDKEAVSYYLIKCVSEENRRKMCAKSYSGKRLIWFVNFDGVLELCRAFPERGGLLLTELRQVLCPDTVLPDDATDDETQEWDELEEENHALREKLEYTNRQLDKALKALGISMLMDTPYEIYD